MRRQRDEIAAASRIAPAEGFTNPATDRSSVVLPEPEPPKKHEHLPAPDRQIEPIERGHGAEADGQRLDRSSAAFNKSSASRPEPRPHPAARPFRAACGTGPIVKKEAKRAGGG